MGTTKQYPTAAAVRAKRQDLILSLTAGRGHDPNPTIGHLVDRFIAEEQLHAIKAGTAVGGACLHYSTASSYLIILNKYIRARWGTRCLSDVHPGEIQAWLTELTIAPKTKRNIKGLLHRIFEKAMVWGILQIQRNPIDLVHVRGLSKRRKMPTVLTPDQFHTIVDRLHDPQRTMVLVAQCTGLRVSELMALQWPDLNFEARTLQVTRAVVNGRVDSVKTECSADLLPLEGDLASILLEWRTKAPTTPDQWVFANPVTQRPYHACSVAKRYLRTTGAELGIQLGWHTFRHTYRSWLDATGAPIGVQQKLMRHAQVSTTMNIYGNALMQSKRMRTPRSSAWLLTSNRSPPTRENRNRRSAHPAIQAAHDQEHHIGKHRDTQADHQPCD